MNLKSNSKNSGLNLEEGEVVELAFKRASVCYVILWSGIITVAILILIAIALVVSSNSIKDQMGQNFITFVMIAALAALVIIGLVKTIVYQNNKLYVTNKRVTQFTMLSLVSTSVNIIDLSSIEDVSFRQNRLLEKIFGYGTLRLSTVGDETTYTFPCVKVAPKEISLIVKLVNDDKEKSDGK